MIVLKMKGRSSYLTVYPTTNGMTLRDSLGHTPFATSANLKFNTWNDAVLGTKELFDNDKGLISINDYEPEGI